MSDSDNIEVWRKSSVVERPWGYYADLHEDAKCRVKKIVVFPGQRISLQSHKHRIEHWTIVSGTGELELGWGFTDKKKRSVKEGSTCTIRRHQIHRITNTSSADPLVFIEVQRGDSFAEEDITRYEDDYGRAKESAPLQWQDGREPEPEEEPFADLAAVMAARNGRLF